MNYIYKFADDTEIQEALDNGTLGKPYVAYNEDLGALDFNSLEPTPVPEPIAWWVYHDTENPFYEFTVGEDDNMEDVIPDGEYVIGQINNVIYVDSEVNVTLKLKKDSDMILEFYIEDESEYPTFTLFLEQDFHEDTGIHIWEQEGGSDESSITIDWDGYFSFTLYGSDENHPLVMTTQDIYPDSE